MDSLVDSIKTGRLMFSYLTSYISTALEFYSMLISILFTKKKNSFVTPW